jgi:hypothetical protein
VEGGARFGSRFTPNPNPTLPPTPAP